MKLIHLLFALLTSQVVVFSQFDCQFIKLCSQDQVDSFPKNYGHCDKIFSIEIDDNCNWVYNLDSLYQVEELGELIIQRMDSLHSIAGLNNLVKVGRFNMVQRSVLQPLLSLDTIIHLRHSFGRTQLDLSMYKNLNHIDTTLSVINSGLLSGLPQFTCSNKFNLTVYENKLKNDFKNLIPQNISNIDQLYITRNENLSLNGIEGVEKISRLIIDRNKSCNFSALNIKEEIERISIGLENYHNNEYGIFKNIKDLKFLSIYETENFKNIDVLFPNLSKVSVGIALRANKHLVDIKILDSFELPNLPLKEVFDPKQRILITDNPFLADCISPYLCKALETYPDSVSIQNNGPNCEKEQLIQDCLTSTDPNEEPNKFVLFPNPVSDRLYWTDTEVVDFMNIFDVSGKVLYSFSRPSPGLDISLLDSGVYFVKIQSRGRLYTTRICLVK